MCQRFSLLLICFLVSSTVYCQSKTAWIPGKEQKQISKLKAWKNQINEWELDSNFEYSLSVLGRLNSDGWTCGLDYQHKVNNSSKRIIELNFSEVQHEKQTRRQGKDVPAASGKSRPFIFGKVNNLYTINIGIGKESLLLPGILNGNLSVYFRYTTGVSLAVLKPYYLDLLYKDTYGAITVRTEKLNENNTPKFLDADSIAGKAKWSEGLKELKIKPGVFAEVSLVLQPAKNRSFIQKTTLGINGAFYSSSLVIIADQKAFPWQAKLFIGLELGKQFQKYKVR